MKYYVPECQIEKLNKIVNRLSKKTNVLFNVYRDDYKFYTVQLEDGKVTYKVVAVDLFVDYKVGDYNVVAELEHHKGGNIVKHINLLFDVPKKYRDCEPYCEHCRTLRNRVNTFVLVDKEGNYKQVGKTCLKEFTGIDAERVLSELANMTSLLTRQDYTEEELWAMSRAYPYREIENEVNKMYQMLIKEGYNKRDPIANLDNYKYNENLKNKVEEILNVVNTKWYSDSEYCHNIKVLLSSSYVSPKNLRLLVSYVNSAITFLNSQIEINNSPLGEIGQRLTFDVKSYKPLYTKYATYYHQEDSIVYRIVTTTNQIVLWSTTKTLDDYCIKSIKGTIKGFKEYKGEFQTIITRGEIIEHKDEEPEEYVEFKGKKYLKGSSTLALDMFSASIEGEQVNWDILA